nr:hypothetical protein [Candidatus Freyarchaeota archaeon]
MGEREEAEKPIDWCTHSKNILNPLPEQVREKRWENESAIQLTWSLYIITTVKLEEK